LMTAALLMLARQQSRGDRRDPWFGWLLTSAAACAVVLSDNLLLLYIALQVLTLAWSGALDETAPRRRGLRLLVQVADIGLLLAAGLAAVALSRRAGPQLAALLLAAQAALAVALSAGSEPLMTVASTWLWLLLVPLAGLTGLAVKSRSLPEALILVNLAILPG